MSKIDYLSTPRFDCNKFRTLRLAKGLDMPSLANELNVVVTTIWEVENRPERKISAELLFRYCDFFGVTVLEIMTDKQKKISITNLANYLEFHNVIDRGSAEGMINFYSKP